MDNRWIRLHSSLFDVTKQLLGGPCGPAFESGTEELTVQEAHAMRDAFRRLADRVSRFHSQKVVNHRNEKVQLKAAVVATAQSAATRCCALASCGARELHVAHFKACAACKTVVYCSKEHQTQDWPNHKAACKTARKPQAQAQEE